MSDGRKAMLWLSCSRHLQSSQSPKQAKAAPVRHPNYLVARLQTNAAGIVGTRPCQQRIHLCITGGGRCVC